ncbi:uroporphyrinogen-III C-methyltransferase [Saccharobesus litoralis]|uniref:Siroheme synthase n=1 Tax=Saccharobesus litoralis TaxID=2172099 RepID=A0A2S0VY45_9ALTE|nr:siroheme synthase CysG [Saccharobesus litoralis]AWB69092.1 uroporphyrinogen-III C-methyltransferase [Saccharobesus litoralis]
MQQFPIFLNLNNFPCAVVGGGDVAFRKVSALLKAQATVEIIAPELCPELAELLEEDALSWNQAHYSPELIQNKRLVVAATDNSQVNSEIFTYCEANRILINTVDQPEFCRYTTPSIIDRSPILIAISSGGNAPVLARRLRAKIETLVPQSTKVLAEFSGQIREQVKAKFTSFKARRHFWERFFNSSFASNIDKYPNDKRQAALQQLMNEESQQTSNGEVWLVGAGPGDPELLTLKAMQKMQQADVIFYDRLVSKDILDLARKDAEFICVGKQKGYHSIPQENINDLLVEYAEKGYKVCRLKGGDPFIFGRGGEEIEPLVAKQIHFQVVPAVTAASGCSAYAGIPLTHRDYAQSVTFVTGHCRNSGEHPNWQTIAQPNQTIVIYMGLSQSGEISQRLISHGIRPDMPVALVEKGSTPEQRVVTTTLSTLSDTIEHEKVKSPALIIVGEVVALHNKLNWYQSANLSNLSFAELNSDGQIKYRS